MLYFLVRPVVRYVLLRYYRNIDITGLENIPPGAPVILAANHPTAFIEPCIMACFQVRTLHFLARGNLYKNKLATTILRALKILPVYRIQDSGFSKLRENYTTFEECYRALSRQEALMILAEGRCIHEKNLRPLRKGTARIALGALQADPALKEVYVVPIGVNFTEADKVRSAVMIRCGAPMLASEFLADYRADPNLALQHFTSHLRQRLERLVIQYPCHQLSAPGELRLKIDRARHGTHLQRGLTHSGSQLDREFQLAQNASNLPQAEPLAQQLLKTRTDLLQAARAGQPGAFTNPEKPAQLYLSALAGLLLQIPVLPLWLIGQVLGMTTAGTVEFYSPVRFAAIAVSYFTIIPLSLILLPWPGKIWLVIALLTTNWAIRQWEQLQQYRSGKHWNRAVPADRALLLEALEKFADSA